MKVFIIEDDINVLSALSAKFRLKKITVIPDSGTDTEEIIAQKIRLSAPDFVVMDLSLARSHGLKILKIIRSAHDMRNLPVFIFSNMEDEESKQRALLLGADHFLGKSEHGIDNAVEKILKIVESKKAG